MGTTSRRRRPPRNRRYRNDREIEEANKRAFKQAAWEQRACAVTDDARDYDEQNRLNWEAHHVVEKRWLKANYLPLWDPRNSLRLRPDVHSGHTSGLRRVPLTCLTDENIEYAFEVMGAAAFDYLTRLYDGTDPRVERAFEVAEAERQKQIAEANAQGKAWTPRKARRAS